jgi:hypothetical protein
MCDLSKYSNSLLAFVFLMATTGGADAGLIGTRVLGQAGHDLCPTCNSWNADTGDPTPVSATVGSGVEFFVPRENPDHNLGLRLDADFTNTTLILNLGYAGTIFPSVFFVDFDLFFTHLNGITDVNVQSNEFSGSSFSFTEDSITVHLPGGTFPSGERKTLVLRVTAVPEGGTSALFLGLSLAALWTLRRSFASFLIIVPLLLLIAPVMATRAQVIESATGTTAASITAARDAFRIDLGGGIVPGANGSFGGPPAGN